MSHTPEIAAPLSGGGFSNFFLRESYQNDAVQFYLRIIGKKYSGFYKCVVPWQNLTRLAILTWCKFCSPFGRAYPDIAAQAMHCGVVVDGEFVIKDGTSCSTPVRTISLRSLEREADHRHTDHGRRCLAAERLSDFKRQETSRLPQPLAVRHRSPRL